MQSAVEASGAAEVNRLAHRWLCASTFCGLVAVVPALRAMEQRASRGELAGAEALLDKASRGLEAARQWLAELADRPQPPSAPDG